MNHATPKMCDLANRLIAHEESASGFSRTENQAVFDVVQKLRPSLEEMMGQTGFRAVVARALALAGEEVPSLAGARMKPDGSLEGFVDPQGQNPTGGAVMLAWLLGLMASFIGELLTVQMVLEIWPKLSLNGYFLKGTHHESTH